MALMPCPRCGNLISDKAPQCPKCGCSLKSSSDNILPEPSQRSAENKRLYLWFIVPIVVGIMLAAGIYIALNNIDFSSNKQEQFNYAADSLNIKSASHKKTSVVMPDQAQLEAEALKSSQQARKNATEWDDFSTPDLVLLDLHGHVKSVTYNNSGFTFNRYLFNISNDIDNDHYNIDKRGRITNLSVTRNNKNQITHITQEPFKLSIEWKGNYPDIIRYEGIMESGDTHLTYYHNQLKYFTFYTLGGSGGFETRENTAISPTEFDNRGNWTKAKLIVTGMTGASEIDKKAESETVTRMITYYPR